MHVEEVADVAESVAHRARFGKGLDVEAKLEHPLAVVFARMEPEQHHAPAYRFRVAESGKVLDFEPAWFG